jgi:hypothetical protein
MARPIEQVHDDQWVCFPGGELEGKRPKVLCPTCREAARREAVDPSRPSGRSSPSRPSSASRPLCFQCYRTELERERAFRAAGDLDTASDARFQGQLPFEPVNRARLETLKAERADARAASVEGIGPYVERRRRAQIDARRALQGLASGLKTRQLPPAMRHAAMDAAIHAAELQLPEAWLPFVVSR